MLLFKGKRFNVLSIEGPLRSGKQSYVEVVDHPGAVVVLALLDPHTLLLIKNQRLTVSETLWELPAGTLEKGEDSKEAAYRELEEETGYRAKKMEPLYCIYSSPGICNEKLYGFVATDLEHVGQKLEDNEYIEVVSMEIQKAMDMIRSGAIKDAKTISLILFYNLNNTSTL